MRMKSYWREKKRERERQNNHAIFSLMIKIGAVKSQGLRKKRAALAFKILYFFF